MKRITLVGTIIVSLAFASTVLSAGRYSGVAPGEAEIAYSLAEFGDPDADPPMLNEPEGIALDWRGNIYFSNRKGDGIAMLTNEIIKITPWGKKTVIADLGPAKPGYHGVLGLTTDWWGNVYAAFGSGNKKTHGVWKIGRYGQKRHLRGSEKINVPNDLVFDWRGNLYVTDSYPKNKKGPGLVWRYGKSDRKFKVWARDDLLAPDAIEDPFPFPAPGANGIAFYPPDHIYVANNEKSIIVEIKVKRNGKAGEVEIVAGAWPPPAGPPSILMAPDGLTVDRQGNLYAAIPPAGLTGPLALSPVVKINPATGEVTPVLDLITSPSELFDFPTSLAFGTRGGTKKNIFVINKTMAGEPMGSGPAITQVGVGVRGLPGQ